MNQGGTQQVLSGDQQRLVGQWCPGAEVIADLSWGLVDTRVLHLRHASGEVIVKAAGPGNGHLRREVNAHRRWTDPWVAAGRIGSLLHADLDHSILAMTYLPGVLVQDTPAEADPQTYRQAGQLLAQFHAQEEVRSDEYEEQMDAKALRWLDGEHRIAPATETRLREAIAAHEHPPALLVPTHGDFQPRNWLIHEGAVAVIDLGRAELRPALTDFARMARREWQGRPDLEAAFLQGYGGDPREPGAWRRTLLREAIGTAAWAYQVGDEPFEAQGHRMIEATLAGC